MASTVLDVARPRRLGARTRKAALVVHIVSAGVWIGIDVVIGVFVFTALFTDDDATKALCYQALELFAIWPLLTMGLLTLASGVLLGLGTKYGLVRYWWVAVKLVINVVFTSLVLISLRPGVLEAAELGRQFVPGDTFTVVVTDLIFPPLVSTTGLIFAVVLSQFKPWGRIRKDARR